MAVSSVKMKEGILTESNKDVSRLQQCGSTKSNTSKPKQVKIMSQTHSLSKFKPDKVGSSVIGSSSQQALQKPTPEEEYLYMTKGIISKSIWREIAEQRSTAITATLAENENLRNKIDQLKSDNQKIEQIVNQAKDMASLLDLNIFGSNGEPVNHGSPEDMPDCKQQLQLDKTSECQHISRTFPEESANHCKELVSNNEINV